MSTKTVYSIRIPIQYKKIMDEMKDVNWQDEIRKSTLELIKEKNKNRIIEEARLVRNRMKKGEDSATLIREDRDAR